MVQLLTKSNQLEISIAVMYLCHTYASKILMGGGGGGGGGGVDERIDPKKPSF